MESGQFRLILDDTITLEGEDEVIGWHDLLDSLIRDKEKGGILLTQDAKFIFKGKGYDYIYALFYTTGYCNEISVRIQEFYKKAWKDINGAKFTIKVPAVKFLEATSQCEVTLEDNSFYARINNNRSLEVLLYSESSKNNEAITPAEFYQIEMFEPSTGNPYPPLGTWGLTGFRVYEAFKSVVSQISDGDVDFASDVFDIGGEWEGLSIMNGYTIRFKLANPFLEGDFKDNLPKISFQRLFEEVSKKKNIAFRIDYSGAKPVLRIENADTLYGDKNTQIKFLNIDSIETKVAVEELYSTLKLGGDYLNESEVDATTLSFGSAADWIGFKRETYTLAGQCNIDRPFDIQGEFIADTNIIEDIIVKGNDNYDDRWIFVETTVTDPNNGVAIQGDPFALGVPPYIYNEGLRNSQVADNFYGYIPNSVVEHLSQLTGGLFFAFKTVNETLPPTGLTDLLCQNDFDAPGFDDGGNYDETISQYIVPAGGTYTFRAELWGFIPTGYSGHFQMVFERRDSGGTLKQTTIFSNAGAIPANQVATTIRNATFNCDAGDKIKVRVGIVVPGNQLTTKILMGGAATTARPFQRCNFSCTNIIDGGGGELLGADPANYRALYHEFKDYPLIKEEFEYILQHQTDSYAFAMDGQKERYGWIKSLKFRRAENKADIILQSALNTNA